jgi:CBS domain-containing protein
MNSIGQLLESKGKDIWTIAPNATVFEGLRIMAKRNVGALLVIDKDNLVGIFSERDTAVGELMTKDVYYIDPKNTLQESMAVMTARHIRHMPVLDKDRLVGMVTLGDVVKQIIAEQEFTIRELEKYISGSYEI